MDEEARKRKLQFRYRRDIGENSDIASLPPGLIEASKELLKKEPKPENLKIKGGKYGRHLNMNPTDDSNSAGMTIRKEELEAAGFSEAEIKALLENMLSEMRLNGTHTSEDGKKVAKVYRNAEWEEWVVRHHVDGKHQKKADYHTNDKNDAHDTAKHWIGTK